MKVYRVEVPNRPIIKVRDSLQPKEYSMMASGFVANQAKRDHEQLFEQVRIEGFSEKPDRLTSIFAFEDLETARWFQQSGRMETGGVLAEHEVTRLDVLHKGDMDLYNAACEIVGQWDIWKDNVMFQGMDAKEAQKCMVQAYWEGKILHPERHTVELLIQGRVEFVKVI